LSVFSTRVKNSSFQGQPQSVGGRSIVVNVSRPKESSGGDYGAGNGGGYRGERRSSY